MTFVAKGYSSPPTTDDAAPAPVDASEVESATPTATAPVPAGEPDVTIVTRVKGPEPGVLVALQCHTAAAAEIAATLPWVGRDISYLDIVGSLGRPNRGR